MLRVLDIASLASATTQSYKNALALPASDENRKLVLDASYASATKRKRLGLQPFEELPRGEAGDMASAQFLLAVFDEVINVLDAAGDDEPPLRLHTQRQRGLEYYSLDAGDEAFELFDWREL